MCAVWLSQIYYYAIAMCFHLSMSFYVQRVEYIISHNNTATTQSVVNCDGAHRILPLALAVVCELNKILCSRAEIVRKRNVFSSLFVFFILGVMPLAIATAADRNIRYWLYDRRTHCEQQM